MSSQGFPLPPELVLEIAECIPAIRDLAAFTRTCRQTHQLASRELYRAAGQCAPRPLERYLIRAVRADDTAALARLLDRTPAARVPFSLCYHSSPAALALLLARGTPALAAADLAELYFRAAYRGNAARVALLLARGVRAALGARDELHVAAFRGQAALLRVLVAHGLPVDARGAGRRVPLSSLCQCWVLNRRAAGWTALHAAAFRARLAAVRVLVALGAEVDAVTAASGRPDVDGATALRIAVDLYLARRSRNYNYLCVVRALVAAGADMVACGAVQMVAATGCFRTLELMLRAGADPDTPEPSALAPLSAHVLSQKSLADVPLGKTAREYFDLVCERWRKAGTLDERHGLFPPGAHNIPNLLSR